MWIRLRFVFVVCQIYSVQTPACFALLSSLFCLSNFKDSCRTAEECCLETFCENTFHFTLLLLSCRLSWARVSSAIAVAKKQNANLKSFRHRPQLGHPLRQYQSRQNPPKKLQFEKFRWKQKFWYIIFNVRQIIGFEIFYEIFAYCAITLTLAPHIFLNVKRNKRRGEMRWEKTRE